MVWKFETKLADRCSQMMLFFPREGVVSQFNHSTVRRSADSSGIRFDVGSEAGDHRLASMPAGKPHWATLETRWEGRANDQAGLPDHGGNFLPKCWFRPFLINR
jgi:hypothetical protein